jgi:hypothetical protein
MPNVSWQTPSNSCQAYLRASNETDVANKNFDAFIDAMAMENSKIEKINAIMEDPDSIILVVEQKKIKFIHSCKKIQPRQLLASSAKEGESFPNRH